MNATAFLNPNGPNSAFMVHEYKVFPVIHMVNFWLVSISLQHQLHTWSTRLYGQILVNKIVDQYYRPALYIA